MALRYDVAFADTDTGNNSLEQSLSYPRAQTPEAATRGACSLGNTVAAPREIATRMIKYIVNVYRGRKRLRHGVLVVTAIVLLADKVLAGSSTTCYPSLVNLGDLTTSCMAELIDAVQYTDGGKKVRRYEVKGTCKVGGKEDCTYLNIKDDGYDKKEWSQTFNELFIFTKAFLTWTEPDLVARTQGYLVGEARPALLGAQGAKDYVDLYYQCALDPFVNPLYGCKPLNSSFKAYLGGSKHQNSCLPGGDAVCPPFASAVPKTAAEAIIQQKLDAKKVSASNKSAAVGQGVSSGIVSPGAFLGVSEGTVEKPEQVTLPLVPSKTVEIIAPMQGAVYPSSQELEVRLQINKSKYPGWSSTGWTVKLNRQGAPIPDFYQTMQLAVLSDQGGTVELSAMIPPVKTGAKDTWQKPGSWHFEISKLEDDVQVSKGASDFAFDHFDAFTATQIASGPKFGSKVPQIAKGTGPALGVGGPSFGGPTGGAGAVSGGGPQVVASGQPASSSLPAVQVPDPGSPEITTRMRSDTGRSGGPTFGGGLAARSVGPMPTDGTPGLMVPGQATTTAARTADFAADLEVVALSLDGKCNVWATLKNGGTAAIRETVKESIALDGRNALTSSVALNLAPGQSQRRQVASYGRINFAEASVRYDVALSDANPGNNSLEQSFTCPKAATETPMRTAPAPGIAPPPSGRTLPGR